MQMPREPRCPRLAAVGQCTELARLVDVVQELSLARSAARIIEILGETTDELLTAEATALLLRDREHWYYADEESIVPFTGAAGPSATACLAGWVMEHRQPVLVADMRSDPRMPADAWHSPRARSVLMVPIRPADPLGAIGACWAVPHPARELETQLLQVLADAAAGALETIQSHALLAERVAERTNELVREITEKRESERRLALALKAGRMGVWELDVASGLVHSDEEHLCMLGYKAGEVTTAAQWMLLVHSADRAGVLKGIRALIDGGSQTEYRSEFRLRTKSGQWRWMLSQAMVAERDAAGQALRVIGTHTDIDARKHANLALGRALAEAESGRRVLDAMMEHIPIALAIADPPGGKLRALSRYGREMLQCEGEELGRGSGLIRAGWTVFHPDGVTPASPAEWPLTRAIANGAQIAEEEWLVTRPDGKRIPVLCTAAPIRDKQSRITGGVLACQDMSRHKLDELALRESEERFRATFEQAAVGVAHVSSSGHWLRINAKLGRMLGYSSEELRYRTFLDLMHPEDRAAGQEDYLRLVAGEIDNLVLEKRFLRKDGSVFWGRVTKACVREAGQAKYVIAVVEDVSERKQLEERIRQVAQHDPLTGLPNRALVYEFGERLLAAARRGLGKAALLFIDLDRFKPINDTYGHDVGDEVLREVARRLGTCLRGEDVVGRLGGDEFVALLSHMHAEADVVKAVTHILHALDQPYAVRGLELQASPSIGVSLFPQDGRNVDELLKNADTAMYHAKKSGRNNVQFFRPELDELAQESLRLESRLDQALERGEFVLYYQPIHDCRTGAMVGAEALLRWPAANVSPERFLPLAEAAGHGQALADWVMGEACRQQRQWRAKGLPEIPLAVNVFPLQFGQKGFAQRVCDAIVRADGDPRALWLEVAESAVVKDVELAAGAIRSVRDAGLRVALAGCSSWSYLARLSVDILKLHPALVRNVGQDRTSTALADALIGLGRSLGMELIAEGVETGDVAEFLRTHECGKAQGFHFSRPMPPAEFESAWLKAA